MLRPAPQQKRSTERLAKVLDTAADLFSEAGYEAATMTELAQRSGSSVGALYSFFPDKESVAAALLEQCGEDIEVRWSAILERTKNLSSEEFATDFVDELTALAQAQPALLALLNAPVQLRLSVVLRLRLRAAMAGALHQFNPALRAKESSLVANVALQVLRGMIMLYAETDEKMRRALSVSSGEC